MKSIIPFVIFSFFIIFNIDARDNTGKIDSVEVIKDFRNLYRYQDFYIAGQPTLEELQWLRSQGVNKIINLRTENENTEFSESAYNEKINAQKLGFEYYSLPVGGNNDYTPGKLDAFASLINKDDKILIHCLSTGRATTFFMAYLIKNKGYTINEAIDIGRNLRFSFPLEMLLDAKVSMEIII
jgi:protein tyrosine phosphatase (PTP) superfamily phosphohydrolase (DUF442 family)